MEVKIKLGKHCFTEAYNCDHKLLNDEEFLKEQIIAAINKTELTLLNISSHKFSPQGITIVALLSESHISIHTWPEKEYAALDIFTCGETTYPNKACDFLIRELESKKQNTTILKRGI